MYTLYVSNDKVIKYVIGIDEVGRGPLAGPITLCGFVVKKSQIHKIADIGITDSKKISPQKRQKVMNKLQLLKNSGDVFWFIISRDNKHIDTNGIAISIRECVDDILKSIENDLETNPNHMDIYLDGSLKASNRYFRQHTIIRGDTTHGVIGAASIIAKLYRDNVMENFDLVYPVYGFYNHKGYGTKEHYNAIKKFGVCELHRISYLKNLKIKK